MYSQKCLQITSILTSILMWYKLTYKTPYFNFNAYDEISGLFRIISFGIALWELIENHLRIDYNRNNSAIISSLLIEEERAAYYPATSLYISRYDTQIDSRSYIDEDKRYMAGRGDLQEASRILALLELKVLLDNFMSRCVYVLWTVFIVSILKWLISSACDSIFAFVTSII